MSCRISFKTTTELIPADWVLVSYCLLSPLEVIRYFPGKLRSLHSCNFRNTTQSDSESTTDKAKRSWCFHNLFKKHHHKDKISKNHQQHFDPHRTWVQIQPRSPNHLAEYLVYSAIAPHNIHGGFTVFVSLLIEACQTFPPLCVCVFVCVEMFVCACSDLSTDMNITCEFTSSKFQTLVEPTSQNKGMVSCFVLGPFERRDSHLFTTHRPPNSPPHPLPPQFPQTHTPSFSLQFHKKRMESLERKAEKLSKSPSVSSFPFQTVSLWCDLIHSFCVLSCSQKAT